MSIARGLASHRARAATIDAQRVSPAANCAFADARAERARSRERSVLRALSPPHCLSHHRARTTNAQTSNHYYYTTGLHHYLGVTSGAMHTCGVATPPMSSVDRESTEYPQARRAYTRRAHARTREITRLFYTWAEGEHACASAGGSAFDFSLAPISRVGHVRDVIAAANVRG